MLKSAIELKRIFSLYVFLYYSNNSKYTQIQRNPPIFFSFLVRQKINVRRTFVIALLLLSSSDTKTLTLLYSR